MDTEDIPPTTLKPAPVMLAWEIVTAAVPVFDRVNVCGLLDPTATFPKFRLVALAASVPEAVGFDPDFGVGVAAPVNPTQPESDKTARDARIRAKQPSGAWRLRTT
jgi:hypothetical protein